MSSIYSFSTPTSKPGSVSLKAGSSSAKKTQGAIKQIVSNFGRLLRKYDASISNTSVALDSLLELYNVIISVFKTHNITTKANNVVRVIVDTRADSNTHLTFNEHFPFIGEKLTGAILVDIQNSERRFSDILNDLGDTFAAMTFICSDCYNLSLDETCDSICSADGCDTFSTSHIISIINIYAQVELQVNRLNYIRGVLFRSRGDEVGCYSLVPFFTHNISSVSGFTDSYFSEEEGKMLREEIDLFYATNNVGQEN